MFIITITIPNSLELFNSQDICKNHWCGQIFIVVMVIITMNHYQQHLIKHSQDIGKIVCGGGHTGNLQI